MYGVEDIISPSLALVDGVGEDFSFSGVPSVELPIETHASAGFDLSAAAFAIPFNASSDFDSRLELPLLLRTLFKSVDLPEKENALESV